MTLAWLRSRLSRLRNLLRDGSPIPRPQETASFVPDGHFYSPVPDRRLFQDRNHKIFGRDLRDIPGVAIRAPQQRALLHELCDHWKQFEQDLTASPISDHRRFNLNQVYFREADALVLYGLLKKFRPRRIIEVGSGHSSAVMLDAIASVPDWTPEVTFIEPYPERLMSVLSGRDKVFVSVLEQQVQDLADPPFETLSAGDLLFIDSSHVSKIGSDVNFLFFEVLPRLQPGVLVHVHDVFWPFEYPYEWIQEGRAWNESYLLRAFLSCNSDFEILLWNSYAGLAFNEWLSEQSPLFLRNTGGSIYLQKVALPPAGC
jgi:predicted O-methyltransferase YrrM